MTVIAIDIGGSGSRILATDGHRGKATGPAIASGDHAAVVGALARAIGPVPGPVECVTVSAAALVSLGRHDLIVRAVRGLWPARLVVVVSDAVAAVVGAWGEAGGGVVAAGTGVVGFGTDLAETWVRSDGWGYLLGDEGGAAWIGARGLRAALRAHDRRPDGSETLLEAARDLHGDPAHLPALLGAAGNAATVLGAFAPRVSEAAEAGDAVAGSILATAAARLAETGLSVMTDGVPPRLALVGGLARQPVLAAGFASAVRARRPDLELAVGERVGSPLEGALRLGRIAAERSLPSRPPYLTVDNQHAHGEGAP